MKYRDVFTPELGVTNIRVMEEDEKTGVYTVEHRYTGNWPFGRSCPHKETILYNGTSEKKAELAYSTD